MGREFRFLPSFATDQIIFKSKARFAGRIFRNPPGKLVRWTKLGRLRTANLNPSELIVELNLLPGEPRRDAISGEGPPGETPSTIDSPGSLPERTFVRFPPGNLVR